MQNSSFCLKGNLQQQKTQTMIAVIAPIGIPAPMAIPTVTIAPGVLMPLAGFGTWQYNSSVSYKAVGEAMKAGYRHIDTAIGYKNQDG